MSLALGISFIILSYVALSNWTMFASFSLTWGCCRGQDVTVERVLVPLDMKMATKGSPCTPNPQYE